MGTWGDARKMATFVMETAYAAHARVCQGAASPTSEPEYYVPGRSQPRVR